MNETLTGNGKVFLARLLFSMMKQYLLLLAAVHLVRVRKDLPFDFMRFNMTERKLLESLWWQKRVDSYVRRR
jgi:hypothetical protein